MAERVTLITGASTGIGAELARIFAANDHRVVLIARRADKLSALAWRVLSRQRGSENDDPTIVRHVHDLAALKPHVSASGDFRTLVGKAMADDKGRGGEATASAGPETLFAGMLDRIGTDPLWTTEYQDYVRQVSFAAPNELIGFNQALADIKDLVALVGTGGRG